MIRLKRLYAHDFKQLQEVEINFPEAGRILVQGKNEAGKSTLFEAVFFALFGQALSTESGAKSLDDLIAYEQEKARVELDLIVRERVFKIMRTLVRGKPNKWELDIIRPDGTIENVRANKAVNDRLVAELGFDAEALLNTCFVEQKKLEKLEGMSKSKREESLAKLDLERLLELENDLKLRGEDEKLLMRLGYRVELAQAQAELPGVTAELNQAEGQLRLLDLRAHLENALAETQASAALQTQLTELGSQRTALAATVTRVDALDHAHSGMDNTLDRFDRMTEDANQLKSITDEQTEITTAVQQKLPALEQRQRGIRALGVQAARLTRVEALRGSTTMDLQRALNQKQELDAQLERGQTLNATIAGHEQRVAELDTKIHNYDIGDVLGEWATAVAATTIQDDGSAALTAKRAERDALARGQRQYLIYLGGIMLGVVVVSALVLPTFALSTGSLILVIIVALILAALATGGVVLLATRILALNRQSSRITEEIGKLEGEMNARRDSAGAVQDRVQAAADKLTALNAPIPSHPAAAQAKRIELVTTLENKTRPELTAERGDIREKLNYARAQRDEVVKRINDLSPSSDGPNVPSLEKTRAKAESILNQWRPRLARRAAQYDLPPETEALREAYRSGQSDIRALETRVQQADKLRADAVKVQARITKSQGELKEQYTQIATLLSGSTPAWSPSLTRLAYLAVKTELKVAFDAAGGDKVRAQMAQVEKQFGALEREHSIRTKNARDSVNTARAIEKQLDLPDGLSSQPTAQELQDRLTNFSQINPADRPAIESQVKELHQRVGALRGARDRFERELGLVGEKVNMELAQSELANARRTQAERKYGAEIVARARRRIVQKILPATMEYMRRILPQLTRDRYHDAKLDPETYKIQVWDERGGQSGAWKEKNIFSGGTKDQFSLALRLAFALATLPSERGTSPGFIFLDEPLGSFDDERANALLYLLTEGEIGRAFDQIFLISHVPVQESKFTHRLRLESGTVVESNLKESA